jgi:acyl-CoA thioester hydrolase
MERSDLDTPYRGGFAGREHRFALSVYFEDTDTFGIVYYANYLKFMERARSDMIRAAGVDQVARLEADGSAYAVADVFIRYRRPARLGDDLVVVSTVEEVRAASVVIQQRVMRGTEELTDARVTAAFLTADGRPQRQPREWVDRFKAIGLGVNMDAAQQEDIG